jgi:hypothetical protein
VGYETTNDTREGTPDVMYRRQHHRGRTTFIVVLAVGWAVGLIGLDGGRTAAFPLFVVGGLALLALWIAGAVRRALETREPIQVTPRVESRNCVVIRPLGSDDHPAGRA